MSVRWPRRFGFGRNSWKCAAIAAIALCSAAIPPGSARAEVLYVNNIFGDDLCNGRAAERVDPETGPLATIQRAIDLADTADVIVIAKTDKPYYESVKLFGRRNSGLEHFRFTIVGNGAVLDGSQAVPPEGWRKAGKDLWKLRPWRKGYYQVLLDGKPVPERTTSPADRALPEIPVGQWCAWRGTIYYRSNPAEYAPLLPFRIAYHDVGLTLYRVRNVEIHDLTLRHFRLDGVSAPDLCRDVVLDRVHSIENGRSGLAVAGTSSVVGRNCELTGNRLHSLLVTGKGEATLEPPSEEPKPAASTGASRPSSAAAGVEALLTGASTARSLLGE